MQVPLTRALRANVGPAGWGSMVNYRTAAKNLRHIYIYILDIRISADASRRTIATKGSCMPSRYTRKNMATHCTHIQVIIIIIILRMRSACAEALQTYIYIYIYTHRESLVRNHEPCAKALGNNIIYNYIYIYKYTSVRSARAVNARAMRKRRTGRLRFNGQYNRLKNGYFSSKL